MQSEFVAYDMRERITTLGYSGGVLFEKCFLDVSIVSRHGTKWRVVWSGLILQIKRFLFPSSVYHAKKSDPLVFSPSVW